MRAAFGLVVVAAVTVLGVVALSDATKYQGGLGAGGTTTIDFSVQVKHYHHDLEDAAASLWYACVGTVGWEGATAPALVPGEPRTYRATITPGLPEDSRRRFRGCLEDGTVDKVRGTLVRMATTDADGRPRD